MNWHCAPVVKTLVYVFASVYLRSGVRIPLAPDLLIFFLNISGNVCRTIVRAIEPEITVFRSYELNPIPAITNYRNDNIEIFGWKQTQA
jgi:hypothetical protein